MKKVYTMKVKKVLYKLTQSHIEEAVIEWLRNHDDLTESDGRGTVKFEWSDTDNGNKVELEVILDKEIEEDSCPVCKKHELDYKAMVV